jgi:hypothetical protein
LETAPEVIERASTLLARLNEIFNDQNRARFASLIDNLDKVSGGVAQEGPAIRKAIREAEKTLAAATRAADSLARTSDSANALLTEDGKPLINELRRAIVTAEATLKRVDSLAKTAEPGVNSLSTQTVPQVNQLVADLRDRVGRDDAPVLIDQEGGRVQRMGPPHWPKYPPCDAYLKAANDPLAARELARLGARLMANDLREVGINVDLLPVLDVPVPGAHEIVGDRAYGRDPETVTQLGRAAAEGLLAGGVLPCVKHMPGHGRAFADSHKDLPTVHADLQTLDAWDFGPF